MSPDVFLSSFVIVIVIILVSFAVIVLAQQRVYEIGQRLEEGEPKAALERNLCFVLKVDWKTSEPEFIRTQDWSKICMRGIYSKFSKFIGKIGKH